jgi:hypothetical protein
VKDKAVILADVIKLHEIRDELTEDIKLLHIQLEQERSKACAFSIDTKDTKQYVSKKLKIINNLFHLIL